MPGFLRRAWMVMVLSPLMLQACASLPESYSRDGSSAIGDYHETSLGRFFAPMEEANPGASGLTLIPRGRNAFTARIAMTQLAEKSLDLQYYIWEADPSGRILANALLEAADRGVRVRLLLDDINLGGRDAVVAALDQHPQVEIRLFNPFANRGFRILDLLGDLGRVNHRMHNKMMIADNALAILGGRNIGDHYFDVAKDANFRDLDIAATGPVVRDTSDVFDYFWNADWSVPIAALVEDDDDGFPSLAEARELLAASIDEESYPHPVYSEAAQLEQEMTEIGARFIWAPTQVVWDDPEDIREGREEGEIITALFQKLRSLERELLVEVAYFVPGQKGAAALSALTERGVRVRVLTNSLSSNDVVAAHSGYSVYRERLLESGVELYEVRADSAEVQQTLLSGKSRAALHTKAAVFDREAIFVGSFNFDPRSANLNTEIGLYAESPELAEQLAAFMDEGVAPHNSYALSLDGKGELVWRTERDGVRQQHDYDPATSFSQRFLSDFMTLLPVESQL